jgi:hypothetical protein
MPDWSIKIVAVANPRPDFKAEFLPDLSKATRGDPLKVQRGDLVSWNNTTGDAHRPWLVTSANAPPTDPPPNKNYLTTTPVPPHSPSDDYYVDVPAGTTLYYCCKLHPAERGSIVVVPFVQSANAPTG